MHSLKFSEGEEGDAFYIIVHGSVRVVGRDPNGEKIELASVLIALLLLSLKLLNRRYLKTNTFVVMTSFFFFKLCCINSRLSWVRMIILVKSP